MIKLNKNTYTKLRKFEPQFRSAYYGCYLVNISTIAINEALEIAKKAGYTGSMNISCGSCKLKFFKEVGKAYFEYQKQLNDEDK